MPKKKQLDPNEEVILSFRVPRYLKDNFSQSCKNIDTTSSRELRAYMRRFVSKYGQDKLLC